MSNGTTIAKKLSVPGLKMAGSVPPPSSEIFVVSSSPVQLKDTEDLSMWLQGDSLVSHSVELANDSEKPTNETCGRLRLNASAWYDPSTHCWRMCQTSFLVDISEPYSETWPWQGMTRSGLYYPLAPLVLHTHDNACSYWPTPTASEALGGGSAKMGERAERREKRESGHNIARRVHDIFKHRFGTPATAMFYEWLMGIPIGGTALEPLAMDKFHAWLQKHGGF